MKPIGSLQRNLFCGAVDSSNFEQGNSAVPLVKPAAGLSIALLGPTASSECNCSEATLSLIGSYSLPGAHVVTLDEALAREPGVSSVDWEPGMASAAGPAGTGAMPRAFMLRLRLQIVQMLQSSSLAIFKGRQMVDAENGETGTILICRVVN